MAMRGVYGVEVRLHCLDGYDQMLPHVRDLMELNEMGQRGSVVFYMDGCKYDPQSGENEKKNEGQNDFTFHAPSILGSLKNRFVRPRAVISYEAASITASIVIHGFYLHHNHEPEAIMSEKAISGRVYSMLISCNITESN